MYKNKFLIGQEVFIYVNTLFRIGKIETISKEYYEINCTGTIYKLAEKHIFKTLKGCKKREINNLFDIYHNAKKRIDELDAF